VCVLGSYDWFPPVISSEARNLLSNSEISPRSARRNDNMN
jgi:hypothetical protein